MENSTQVLSNQLLLGGAWSWCNPFFISPLCQALGMHTHVPVYFSRHRGLDLLSSVMWDAAPLTTRLWGDPALRCKVGVYTEITIRDNRHVTLISCLCQWYFCSILFALLAFLFIFSPLCSPTLLHFSKF